MKYLILLLFVPFQVYASADYHCQVRSYDLDIDMTNDKSTHVWITNRYDYNVLYQGYVGSIERGNKVTSFTFYGNSEPTILSFPNTELESEPQKLTGHIDAMLEGFLIVDYFACSKK